MDENFAGKLGYESVQLKSIRYEIDDFNKRDDWKGPH